MFSSIRKLLTLDLGAIKIYICEYPQLYLDRISPPAWYSFKEYGVLYLEHGVHKTHQLHRTQHTGVAFINKHAHVTHQRL